METQHAGDLEHKLEFSNQLLMKIYKELAKTFSPSAEQGPPEEIQLAGKDPKELECVEPISLEFEMVNDDSMQLEY